MTVLVSNLGFQSISEHYEKPCTYIFYDDVDCFALGSYVVATNSQTVCKLVVLNKRMSQKPFFKGMVHGLITLMTTAFFGSVIFLRKKFK